MVTEKERESLVASLESLLQKYNYKYTVEALNKIIDEWCSQKGWLIEAFKKHPGYVEGKFMITLIDEYQRDVDEMACQKFTDWWVNYPYQDFDLVKEDVRNLHYISNISTAQFSILRGLHLYTERCIPKDVVAVFKRAFPDVNIHVGEKMTRVVNRLFNYLGYDRHEDYQKEFAKYSDAMTPKTVKRRIVLSVNPLDYLTMSFGNSWASCHTIDKENIRDMPNSYEGMYSSGTMSYMLDPSSMVMYTVDQKYDGNEYWDQPKINRQMFHYGEEKLVQGRLYPQDNDRAKREYTEYARVVLGIISTIFDIKNEWTSTSGSWAASRYIDAYGTHYEDYANYDNCTLHTPKGCGNTKQFIVGHHPICVRCGETHDTSDSIDCCIYPRCKCCGRRIYDSDTQHHINGEVYCYHCVSYCQHCNEYFVSDRHMTEDGYVCDNCFNEHYVQCEECRRWVREGRLEEYEGDYVCSRCHNRLRREQEIRERNQYLRESSNSRNCWFDRYFGDNIRITYREPDDSSWPDDL